MLTATSPLWRDRFTERLERARIALAGTVEGDQALRHALAAAAPEVWLAVAGEPARVRAWAQLAQQSGRAWMALIEPQGFSVAEWPPGPGAVLDPTTSAQMLGAALDAARAGLLVLSPALAQAGSRSSEAPSLSPREREVLTAAAAGLSTKAIARELGVSPNTVKFHLQAVYAKLGAATRTEAVVSALRGGVLSI